MVGVRLLAKLERRAAQVGLDLIVLGFLSSIFLVLAVIYGGELRLRDGSVIWPTLIVIGIVVYRVGASVRRGGLRHAAERKAAVKDSLRVVRDWLPLILMIMVYENLRALTGLIRPEAIDAHLYAADIALLGVEPTIWIQQFANPWLTDYFAFAYLLYFVLPIVIGTILYVGGRRDDSRELMLGLILVQYVGFGLYVIFPAGPPRYFIASLFDPPQLTGALGLFEATQGTYDRINQVVFRSSFPSLHCALSLTGLLYAWKFRGIRGGRVLFWGSVPLVVSLWVSTIYLRHHWIVDCFAGFALSLAMFPVASWLWGRHEALRSRVLTATPVSSPTSPALSA